MVFVAAECVGVIELVADQRPDHEAKIGGPDRVDHAELHQRHQNQVMRCHTDQAYAGKTGELLHGFRTARVEILEPGVGFEVPNNGNQTILRDG